MMNIENFMSPDSIFIDLAAQSKKQVLDELCKRVAEQIPELDPRDVLSRLQSRERLGCTGIGNGIAIPHAKCEMPQSRTTPIAALATLAEPIDFDANDDIPVDIVFMLLAADSAGGEHLTLLALASRLLTTGDLAKQLRECKTANEAWTAILAAEMDTAA